MGNDDSTGLRRHRAPEDHRRLLPAADAGAHEVDHGGQSRAGLRARHAHAARRCSTAATTRSSSAKGTILRESADDRAVIVSSGRGVHEALAAADAVRKRGIAVGVVDMPSIDEELLLRAVRVAASCWSSPSRTTDTSGRISSRCCTAARKASRPALARVVAINTLDAGRPAAASSTPAHTRS